MSVRIRLRRVGRKKQPYFRVVVASSDAPRDGSYIDEVGFYNPRTRPAFLTMDLDKVDSWLEKGAEVTTSAASLISKARKGGDDAVRVVKPGEETGSLKTAGVPERRPTSKAVAEPEAATEEPEASAATETEEAAEAEAPEAEATAEEPEASAATETEEASAEEPEAEAAAEEPEAEAATEEPEAEAATEEPEAEAAEEEGEAPAAESESEEPEGKAEVTAAVEATEADETDAEETEAEAEAEKPKAKKSSKKKSKKDDAEEA